MEPGLITAVWTRDDSPRFVWYGASATDLQSRAWERAQSGYTLISLDVTASGAWSAVWQAGNVAQDLMASMTWSALRDADAEKVAAGLHLTHLKRHPDSDTWLGTWQAAISPTERFGPVEWNEFFAAFRARHQLGQRLVDCDTFETNGTRRWIGLWRAGLGDQTLWSGLTWQEFEATNQVLAGAGQGLRLARSYPVGSTRRWFGLWHPSSETHLDPDLSLDQFWTAWDAMAVEGLRLRAIHVWDGTSFAPARTARGQLQLHVRVVDDPDIPIETMIARMREVYEPVGVMIEVASFERVPSVEFLDVEVGTCMMGDLSADQQRLFAIRGSSANELVVYFVRSTIPPYNGCAAHPPTRPGAVISSFATEWTLAHEVGHVLGLAHISDSRRLMTGLGTANIVDPPPDLMPTEVTTVLASPHVSPL